MSGQAKTISDEQLQTFLERIVSESKNVLRDYAIVLFSFKAGLRAGEIAKLEWRDVIDATGKIGQKIGQEDDGSPVHGFTVPAKAAKKGHTRTIPFHPALMVTLIELRKHKFGSAIPKGPIIEGAMGGRISPDALRQYVQRLYREHGLDCTSHSGRRTMITKMARAANSVDCSLRDVQMIAGHKYIDTTERYVEASANVGKLVRMI